LLEYARAGEARLGREEIRGFKKESGMHEENVELSWESDSQPRSLFMYIIPYSRSLGGKRGGGGKEVSLLKYNRELRN
jgi:hypothetical protein